MRKRWLTGAAITLLVAGGLVVGCSSDDVDADPIDDGAGGTGGVDTPDASTEEPDAADDEPDAADPDANDDDPFDPGSEECGTATCEGVGSEQFSVAGCCVDADTEACGLMVPGFVFGGDDDICMERDQPGNLDPSCGELPLDLPPPLTASLPGCCLPAGTCGFSTEGSLVAQLGVNLGCVDPAEAGLEVEPKSCIPGEPGDPPEEPKEPASEACGTITCEGAGEGDFIVDGCCADEDEEACGLLFTKELTGGDNDACITKSDEGKLDGDCDSHSFHGHNLAGCCLPDDTCGFSTEGTDLEGLGVDIGCVSAEALSVELADGPKACTFDEDEG